MSSAQIPEVLLEACNNIQDSEKRFTCLKAAASTKNIPAQNSATDLLKKAFGDIRAGLEIGVSYNNYQLALIELAKAISTFKKDANQKEKAGLDYFEEALDAYTDAGVLWGKSIEFYSRRDNSLAYGGGLPISLPRIGELAFKYKIQTVKADLLGFHRGVPVNSSRALIWGKANEKAEEGFKVIDNPVALAFNEAVEICGKYMTVLKEYKNTAIEDNQMSDDTVLSVKYRSGLSCLVGRANRKVLKVVTGEVMNKSQTLPENKTPPPDPKIYSKFVADAKAILESSVNGRLVSIQYRSLYISGETHPILCGEVDIKTVSASNSGFKRFYANSKTMAAVEDPQDNVVFLQMWPAVCEPKLVDVE